MNRSQKMNSNTDEIDEIKTTTHNLSKEMKHMRKLVEELQISINEKDAEICRLNMHLGDEKKRFQNLIRKQSQKSLLQNASTSSLIKKSMDSQLPIKDNQQYFQMSDNKNQFSGGKDISFENSTSLREELN